MSYKALYREYRPTTWDEVVGQKYIVKTLKNAIKNNRIAHAYLFTGPRGTGKTTIARLLAASLNCTSLEDKPCGKCDNCKAIEEGTFPDVIEIDAASNNGVEEARDLIDKVKYTPLEGKYKVYIIDEVHMMTGGAFNTLLKTLEEPPSHVIFILATTEIQKVLPTIISRCQRFDFSKISEEDLGDKIKYILNKENITYENRVINLITSLAEGGCRNAESILDQAIAYAGNNITCQDVRDIYGVLSTEEIIKFINLLSEHKVVDCLNSLKEFDSKGIDIVRLTNNLIDILKDIVVYTKTLKTDCLKVLKDTQALQLSFKLDSNTIFEYIDILMDAIINYKKVDSVRSYFELTILKICDVKSNDDLIKRDTSNNIEAEHKVYEQNNKPIINNINEVKEENIVEESNTVNEAKEEPNNSNEGHFFDTIEESKEEEPTTNEYVKTNDYFANESKQVETKEELVDTNNTYEPVEEENTSYNYLNQPNEDSHTQEDNFVEETIIEVKKEVKEIQVVNKESPTINETPNIIQEQSIFSSMNNQTNTIEQPNVVEEPKIVLSNFIVDDQTVIKFFANSTKDNKIIVVNLWTTVRRYLTYPKFNNAAKLLQDCSVLAAGPNTIVFTVDTDIQVSQINGFENYFECKELIKEILGKEYYYIAVKESEVSFYTQAYRNALNLKTVPVHPSFTDLYNKQEVELYKKQHASKDEALEKGKALFGDDIKIEG